MSESLEYDCGLLGGLTTTLLEACSCSNAASGITSSLSYFGEWSSTDCEGKALQSSAGDPATPSRQVKFKTCSVCTAVPVWRRGSQEMF
jgi:hypothetical protein